MSVPVVPVAAGRGPRSRVRRVLNAEPWRAAGYLLSYLVVGTVLFAAVVTAVVTAGALVPIWIGLPLLLAAAVLVRGAAHLERQRATLVVGVEAVAPAPAAAAAHPGADGPTPPRLVAAVKRRWTDPSMGPSLGYLVGLYPLLLALDAIAVSLWLSLLGGTTIPLWYRVISTTIDSETVRGLQWGYFPDGPNGPDAIGLYIDDLPTALVAAGLCAVLFAVVACPLVTAAARLHARIAHRLLGPPVDPLAAARTMLRGPGPLTQAPPARLALVRPLPRPTSPPPTPT